MKCKEQWVVDPNLVASSHSFSVFVKVRKFRKGLRARTLISVIQTDLALSHAHLLVPIYSFIANYLVKALTVPSRQLRLSAIYHRCLQFEAITAV